MAMNSGRRGILAGAAAFPLFSFTAQAQGAAATAPAPDVPGFHRIRVGGYTVTFLFDGIARSPLEGMVLNEPIEAVRGLLAESFMPTDHFLGTYTAVMVDTGGRKLLFDAGTGGQLAPTAGSLVANLRAAGVEPGEIDTVVLTHCHGDHIVGLTTAQNEAVFTRAELVVPEGEWRFWTDRGNETGAPARQRGNFAQVARRFAPYEGRLRRIADGQEVERGIQALATPGHTPFHTSWLVADGAEQLLILGDVAHRPELFVRRPDFHVMFDFDPQQAEATRKRILDRVATDRMRLTGYHFPFPAHGFIARDGAERFRFVPSNWVG
jgi:glyoxylase-like metal-dependent hydrolase (beta-lactamase superfamily II)